MAQDDAGDLRPPLGMHPARVDDKGRLKLPVVFQNYLNRLGSGEVFVTSLDRRVARIYPVAAWLKTMNTLDDLLLFTANDLGGETSLDNQGRILLMSNLRRELGIENAPVFIYSRESYFEVLTEAIYQERRARAMQAVSEL